MMYLAKKIGDITIEEIAEILPFVFLGMLAVCGICLLIIKMKDKENDKLPVLEMAARVIDKQQVASNEIAFVIWIMFETEDGTRVRLSCKAQENYLVGDKGILRWQGTRLLSFDRNKAAAQ
ncbi:MAG: DUF2500 domain-containing protein [Oscillospiraceae bacterium]|nr:DUF2500 domain-containing protein [Oscillospiraceae bacterium]